MGRLVKEIQVHGSTTEVNDLQPGVYILTITEATGKIIACSMLVVY